jgi:subtilisin family serine protease
MTRFVYVLLISLAIPAAAGASIEKLTPAAAAAIQRTSPDGTANYWLFLDESSIDRNPVHLTERALKRRDRVDQVGHLIDARDYAVSAEVVDQIAQTGATIRRVSRWFKAVSIEATPAQLAKLGNLSAVTGVDVVRQLAAPTEPESEKPTPPMVQGAGISAAQNDFTKMTRLHQYGLTGRGVLVALFDGGFDINHRAFDSANIVATYDFIHDISDVANPDCLDNPSNAQDVHGTAVFGALGGFMPDTLVGAAYKADFALAKTEVTCYSQEIKVEEDNWIAAAEWADSLGADIISSSLGYYAFDDSGSYTRAQLDGNTARITVAADIAAAKNILVVVAAGNERQKPWGTITFPADGDSVIAVGALTIDSQVAIFSSPGPTADGRTKPDISTLGMGVVGAQARGSYTYQQGTSLATPLVAGGAALALEQFPELTAVELRELITSNGSRANHPDNNFGYGAYDAARSAGLLSIERADTTIVRIGEQVELPIRTTGRLQATPILAAIDPPEGMTLIDLGDGSGRLAIEGRSENIGSLNLRLTASAAGYVDTTVFVITTYPESDNPMLAIPNPFRDSVKLLVRDGATVEAVAVFTVAGEIVWQWHKGTSESADIVEWDGRNAHGQIVAPGVYLVRVQTSRGHRTVKVLKTG